MSHTRVSDGRGLAESGAPVPSNEVSRATFGVLSPVRSILDAEASVRFEPPDKNAELLARWCEGDRQAGDTLLRSVSPQLYRFLSNKVGDDTPEVIQLTMLACVEHRDKLADCANFEAYLLRMARNKLFDFLRKRRRSRLDFPGDLPSVHELDTPTSGVLGGEARVREVLRSLPVDLKVVLQLHYWNELSTGEIGYVLDIPRGTVKSRLRRAREAFGQRLRQRRGGAVLLDASRTVRL